jgi:hypothetical protein
MIYACDEAWIQSPYCVKDQLQSMHAGLLEVYVFCEPPNGEFATAQYRAFCEDKRARGKVCIEFGPRASFASKSAQLHILMDACLEHLKSQNVSVPAPQRPPTASKYFS